MRTLMFGFLSCGLLYHAWEDGFDGLGSSLGGVLFGTSGLIALYVLGVVEYRELMIMSSICAWFGMPPAYHVFLAGSLVTVALGLVRAIVGSSGRWQPGDIGLF